VKVNFHIINKGALKIVKKRDTSSVHLRLNDDLINHVDNFTSRFYFNSRQEAIRYLIALGLNYHDKADHLMRISEIQDEDKKG
jgi:metal-responsive CopG/Arc/MetJ family transcriptional regulator